MRLPFFYLIDDAVSKMAFKQDVLDVREGLFGGGSLSDDIDAIRIFLNHFYKAANLPFDNFEPADNFLRIVIHKLTIPPRG